MDYQATLHHRVRCTGVGLHSGKEVNIALAPAAEDTGIVFVRTDIAGPQAQVRADALCVQGTMLGTTLVNAHGVSVATVEHLMAALWGCGIDNAVVELDAPEVPIMDGSSEPFVFLLECAGKLRQSRPRRFIEVLEEITVTEGESRLTLTPADTFSLSLEIDFQNPAIAFQSTEFDLRDGCFKRDLSRARTFGFAHEVDRLRAMGLAKGGSLENAIVVGENGVLNAEGLRYADEFARHKALDCVGDFFLAGARLKGRVEAYRPGHAINNRAMRELLSRQNAWRMVEEAAFTPSFAVMTQPQAASFAQA